MVVQYVLITVEVHIHSRIAYKNIVQDTITTILTVKEEKHVQFTHSIVSLNKVVYQVVVVMLV